MGPDHMLRACAGQLAEAFHYIFTLSLELRRVSQLWKTFCIIPVPKVKNPKTLNDDRPVALTSHIMKDFFKTGSAAAEAPGDQFHGPSAVCLPGQSWCAIMFLLHRAASHLEEATACHTAVNTV